MAQQAETLGVSLPTRSLSDRPFALRALANSLNFLRSKPLGAVGVLLITVMVFTAFAAPFISRYDPGTVFSSPNPEFDAELYEQSLVNPLIKIQNSTNKKLLKEGVLDQWQGPSAKHWLGTDGFGHDLYARIIYGARLSLVVGIGGAIIAVAFGIVFGLVSAYFGGMVDLLFQRVADAFQAFPALVLLLLFVQVVPDPNKWTITVALGIVGIAQVIRLVRGSVLQVREEVYVSAARVIGASDIRIMLRHILPNIVAPIIVVFTISIGLYILAESGLAFIGLGDPGEISWGKMINEGRSNSAKPTMALFTGIAISLAVLGFNLAGDALRDVLDPRLRGRGNRAGF